MICIILFYLINYFRAQVSFVLSLIYLGGFCTNERGGFYEVHNLTNIISSYSLYNLFIWEEQLR